ncbi:hypothetical protein TKK_0000090 [Trichogramma kaykai]|uniref:Uncharacterized protein n=1 Tax=Trichogramma kaykai TaxID=54128 RepID=A0ABD2VSZ5_9HYME
MVEFNYYDPSDIFVNDSRPEGMAGAANFDLAESFARSRGALDRWDRNAGAVALYRKDGVTKYVISENSKDKKYNAVSYGNKHFKNYTASRDGFEATSYGHTERKLMRDVLDDLLADQSTLPGPTSVFESLSGKEKEYEVLKYLTHNADKYKRYLEEKGIIVKIWSERPSCTAEANEGFIGGSNCTKFIQDICPEGSQYGFIVKDYVKSDNLVEGVPKVRMAYEALKNAYEKYKKTL